MNAIEPLSLSKLSTGKLLSTSIHLVAIVEDFVVDHPLIARQVSSIKTALETIEVIDRTPQGSELTGIINDGNDAVDSLIPMLINHLESSIEMKQFNLKKGEAAEALIADVEKRNRKNLIHGGWDDQGKELRALLGDLFDPSQDENRADAGVDQILTLLKDTYASLQTNLELRLNEGNLPSNTLEQKKILRYRLNRLLDHIDVNIVDEVEGFDTLKTPVNELITEVMAQYRARTTRKETNNN